MKTPVILSCFFIFTLAITIWLKQPNNISNDTDIVTDKYPTKRNLSITKSTIKRQDNVRNEIATSKKLENKKSITEEAIIFEDIEGELELLSLSEEAFSAEPEYEIFTGNSNYTGDDTEDNDAGNLGFEDDFPEQNYAYDDHSAEAYTTYTESYGDDY